MSGDDASLTEKIIIIWVPAGSSSNRGDNWNAHPLVKATFAFEIIWFVFSLYQLCFPVFYHRLPEGTRRPYIVLLFATLATVVYYLMAAIETNVRGRIHSVITDRMNIATSILYILPVVLQPAAVLSLARQLSISKPWKRILDWTLVGVTFILYIAALANNYVAAGRTAIPTPSLVELYARTSQALGHTVTALVVLLSLDVIISSISLLVGTKPAPWIGHVNHQVASFGRIILPFSTAYALQWLTFHVYFAIVPSPSNSYNALAADFSRVMVEGVGRIGITGGLIATMDV